MITTKRILELIAELPCANLPDWPTAESNKHEDKLEYTRLTNAAYAVMNQTRKILADSIPVILDPQLALYDKNAPLSDFSLRVPEYCATLALNEYKKMLYNSLVGHAQEKVQFLLDCTDNQAAYILSTVNSILWQYATLEPVENLIRTAYSLKNHILSEVSMESVLYLPSGLVASDDLLDLIDYTTNKNAVVRKIWSFDKFFLANGKQTHLDYWASLKNKPEHAKHLAALGYEPITALN